MNNREQIQPHETIIENYRGLDIVRNYCKNRWGNSEDTDFFKIKKGDEYITLMAMATVKACRNVIDTHLGKECKHIDLEIISKKQTG